MIQSRPLRHRWKVEPQLRPLVLLVVLLVWPVLIQPRNLWFLGQAAVGSPVVAAPKTKLKDYDRRKLPLFNFLASEGRYEEARAIFEEQASGTSRVWWNIMLKAYAKAGEDQMARRHFEEMQSRGIEPNWKCLGKLAESAAKAGNVTAAKEWYDLAPDMPLGDQEDWLLSRVLDACARVGDSKAAVRTWQEAAEDNYQPSFRDYHYMIYAFANAGDVDGTKEWLNLMAENGFELGEWQHGALLKAYAKAGHLDDAEVEMRSLELSNTADMVDYNVVIGACAAKGDVPRANRWYKKMLDAGHTGDIIIYRNMMNAHAQAKDLEGAMEWFQVIKGEGLDPEDVSYGILMNAFSKAGKVAACKDLYVSMRQARVRPSPMVYGSLIDSAAKKGMLETAAAFFRVMTLDGVEPSVIPYNMLLLACSRTTPRSVEAGEVIFTRMVQTGIQPTLATMKVLVKAVAGFTNARSLCNRLGVDFDGVSEGQLQDKLEERRVDMVQRRHMKLQTRRIAERRRSR